MPHVTIDTVIDAPVDAVFALSQDYDARLSWDPFLSAIRFLDGAEPALGAHVWVRARSGLEMTVEYVSFRAPELVAVKMVEGPRMFRTFGATWRFAPEDASTRVTFQYAFSLRGWTVPMIAEPISALLFRRDMRKRLAGLKARAEQPSGDRSV
jgi:ribosome-associated toxin RatA of RatAB toxin-antitoxin module